MTRPGLGEGRRVVAVVITYNSAVHIASLVAGVRAGFEGVEGHLVVVDNGSHDDSVDLVRRLAPEATVVPTGRNGGYAAGINAGVAVAPPHDAVLILNPDVRLEAGCVAELLRATDEPRVGIAVPRLENGQGTLIRSLRREPTLLRALGDTLLGTRLAGRHPALGEFVSDPAVYDAPAYADWAEGSVQLVTAACWHTTGRWDESFFLYSEEVEYDLRAAALGFRLRYVPTARAVHLQGDSRISPGLRRLVVLNRVRLFRRRAGLLRAVPFWLVVVLREGSRALLRRQSAHAAFVGLLSPSRWRQSPGPEAIRD